MLFCGRTGNNQRNDVTEAEEKRSMRTLPPSLSVELTTRCNYACPFCYGIWHERPSETAPDRELDVTEWGDILVECACRGVESVQFTGGEPLLREDLDAILDCARAVGLSVILYTNGSLLTEERLQSFKQRQVRLATSLPGLASYGTMTGTNHSPWPVLEAIERAAELDWPMTVGIPLARPNLSEATDLVAAAAFAGASVVQVGPAMWEGRMRRNTAWMLNESEWKTAKAALQVQPKLSQRVVCSEEFFCTCRTPPGQTPVPWPESAAGCPAGQEFGVLGVSGRYRICLHATEEYDWRSAVRSEDPTRD
ncbi:radical SAM protein [bacterium]|nr:radical SAM protein [bacterium]